MTGEPTVAQERRFTQLFNRVGTGIAVAAADGRFLEVNPAFCRTVGYSAEELLERDFLSLTHPDDREANVALVGRLLRGLASDDTLEKRYLTKDGGIVWVRAHISAMRDEELGEVQLVATTEDITAQRSVEEQLAQSEALMRIAGRVGRVGGWAIDTDPVKLYWSDEIHDLLGYPRGQTPPLDAALQLYRGDEGVRMSSDVDRCIDEGIPFDGEYIITDANGESFWVRVVGEPRRGPDGRVERIQGAIMDISEHKRAQRETQELAERLTATMESITDALYTVDRDWRFTYVNERAQEVLERDPDGLIGRTLWTEFPATIGTELEESFRRALAEQRTVVVDDYYYEPLDRYFGVNVYPSEQGLAVYFRDVTDERAIRVELEERGARLAEQAALLDEAQDAIVVRDLDGRITFWNRSAERIYGWTAQEAAGRTMVDLLAVDPDRYLEAHEHLLAHGSWVGEVSKSAKDGRELTIGARWTLVRDDDARPSSVLQIDTDITERKRIEQQFLRSQRMESIGQLAGGIAHDLNNALAPISMSVELLREEETDPEKLRMLGIIERSATHGAEMVEQVLSFARGMDGRREPVSVDAIVEEVARICADTFPKDITVRAVCAPDLWPVVGDPTQLQQVLVNLCVNARDAMPDGGTLTLSASNCDAPASDGAPRVDIWVRDTGVGIEPDVVGRMFDPFFSTKPHGEGTGLGLSTSLVIVQSHGGSIDVTSEPGAGTTVEVRLPAEPTSEGSSAAPAPTLQRGQGELVLVVDDEEAIRDIAEATLRRYGYRVAVAADGAEAVAVVAERREDVSVVVTDLMMPVLDGYSAIAEIRRRRADLPIIATSGLNTTEASERSLAAGATRFLAKPYDVERLLREIREVLRAHA